MYGDAGPSRPTPYGGPKAGLNGPGPSRAGPSRWDNEYDRDDRPNGYGRPEPPRSYAIPPWQNRPPSRSNFRPGSASGPRPRSHTPSPPRRGGYDRDRSRDRERGFDVRDRLSLEPGWRSMGDGRPGADIPPPRRAMGFGPPPRDRGADREGGWAREDRRWPERRDDRDRFRDDPLPPRNGPPSRTFSVSTPSQGSRYPSDRSTPRSPPSAPRNTRPLPGIPPPTYSSSRVPSGPRPGTAYSTPSRDDRDSSSGLPARDVGRSMPASSQLVANQLDASPNGSAASQAPRTMRGSSSPVDTRRPRDQDGQDSGPSASLEQAENRASSVPAEQDHDLEEGEVVSPVQQARNPVRPFENDERELRGREKWSPPRERDRDRWEWDRERARRPPSPQWNSRRIADGWSGRGRKRSTSNPTRWRGSGLEEGPVGDFRSPPPIKKPTNVSEEKEVDSKAIIPPEETLATSQTLDRPLTPPIPAAANSTSSALSISVPSPLPPSSLQVEDPPLSATSATSRPDTPALPSPINQTSQPLIPESIAQTDIHTDLPRPNLPIAKQPTADVVENTAMNGDDDALMDGTNKMDQSDDDEHRSEALNLVVPVESPLDTKEVEAEDPKPAFDQAVADITEANSVVTSDLPHDLPALSPTRLIDPASMDADLTEHAEQPPTPMAPTSPSESAVTPAMLAGRTPVEIDVNVAQNHDVAPSPTLSAPISHGKFDGTSAGKSPSAVVSSDGRSSPPSRRVTIAERRAVTLPATDNSITSPFGARLTRKDPMPTADSTDTETEAGPKTGEIDDRDTPMFEDTSEETKQSSIISAVKAAQVDSPVVDIQSIVAWNVAAAPSGSTRPSVDDDDDDDHRRNRRIAELTWPLFEQEAVVAKLVSLTVAKEKARTESKSERLKAEYLDLDEEWRDHCDFLDGLMEQRGPPPADLYAVPNAIPLVTPGPVVPSTPVADDSYSSRANRRRGAGDAVTTEAEFQEILAGLADTAAKDPNYRASKTAAVIPDMILDAERRLRYDDDNDLITDPLAFYDFAGIAEPIWAPEERAQFVRRYMAYPKQFGRIADGIPNKTSSDCVLYYYRTKKEVDYKGMLASKRGGGKKKTIIKKGGKSAALLSDLARSKPPVNGSETPVRGNREDSVVPGTSARRGRPPATPGENGPTPTVGRRRKLTAASNGPGGNDEEDQGDSAVTSRAGSEAPSAMGGKSKMRVTVKTAKRPRISSLTDIATPKPALPAAPTSTNAEDSGLLSLVQEEAVTADATTAQTELLPPVKRAGKRRKVAVEADVNADSNTAPTALAHPTGIPSENAIAAAEGATPASSSADKPSRRPTTNSYWSVEEKRRVKELVAVHGVDVKVIASQLKGKSERQVSNFLEAHRTDLGASTNEERGEERKIFGNAQSPSADLFKPAQATRTIYDAFPNLDRERYPSEPRLGMFPTASTFPHSHAHAQTDAAESPIKTISRPGGMRISALLNDDAAESKPPLLPDTIDAASDGTVDERDFDGVLRPSPRSIPSVPAPASASAASTYARYDHAPYPLQRPDLDRYRSASSASTPPLSSFTVPAPAPAPASSQWSAQAQAQAQNPREMYHRPSSAVGHSAAVQAPSMPHRASWDSPATHQQHQHHHHHSHPRYEYDALSGSARGPYEPPYHTQHHEYDHLHAQHPHQHHHQHQQHNYSYSLDAERERDKRSIHPQSGLSSPRQLNGYAKTLPPVNALSNRASTSPNVSSAAPTPAESAASQPPPHRPY